MEKQTNDEHNTLFAESSKEAAKKKEEVKKEEVKKPVEPYKSEYANMGYEIPRGSFVTSYPQLSKETGLTVQQVRTAIFHLKSTGEITVKTTSKFSIITVNKYISYQSPNRRSNSQSTGNQQSSNSQSTTIEHSNKGTREQKRYIPKNSHVIPKPKYEITESKPASKEEIEELKKMQQKAKEKRAK